MIIDDSLLRCDNRELSIVAVGGLWEVSITIFTEDGEEETSFIARMPADMLQHALDKVTAQYKHWDQNN